METATGTVGKEKAGRVAKGIAGGGRVETGMGGGGVFLLTGDAHNYRTPTKPHKNHNKTPNRKPASETAGNCGDTDTDVGDAVHEFAGVRKLLLQSVTMTGDSLTRLRRRR